MKVVAARVEDPVFERVRVAGVDGLAHDLAAVHGDAGLANGGGIRASRRVSERPVRFARIYGLCAYFYAHSAIMRIPPTARRAQIMRIPTRPPSYAHTTPGAVWVSTPGTHHHFTTGCISERSIEISILRLSAQPRLHQLELCIAIRVKSLA